MTIGRNTIALMIIVMNILVRAQETITTDLAFRCGSARQSSTMNNKVAKMAIDNKASTFSATVEESSPWWIVDLLSDSFINEVFISFVPNLTRAFSYKVVLIDDDNDEVKVKTIFLAESLESGDLSTNVKFNASGRIVMIQVNGGGMNHLALFEVRVLGMNRNCISSAPSVSPRPSTSLEPSTDPTESHMPSLSVAPSSGPSGSAFPSIFPTSVPSNRKGSKKKSKKGEGKGSAKMPKQGKGSKKGSKKGKSTKSPEKTKSPSVMPSVIPSVSPAPSESSQPSTNPTSSPEPSIAPSSIPSDLLSSSPSSFPSDSSKPSYMPSIMPSKSTKKKGSKSEQMTKSAANVKKDVSSSFITSPVVPPSPILNQIASTSMTPTCKQKTVPDMENFVTERPKKDEFEFNNDNLDELAFNSSAPIFPRDEHNNSSQTFQIENSSPFNNQSTYSSTSQIIPPSSPPVASFPSLVPSMVPLTAPSHRPSQFQTSQPIVIASENPTIIQTGQPSSLASDNPSQVQTYQPSVIGSENPSQVQTLHPSVFASGNPSQVRTNQPSVIASGNPSHVQTLHPSVLASNNPSQVHTLYPSVLASNNPSQVQTYQPSDIASGNPSQVQTDQPSVLSSNNPSRAPILVSTSPSSYFKSSVRVPKKSEMSSYDQYRTRAEIYKMISAGKKSKRAPGTETKIKHNAANGDKKSRMRGKANAIDERGGKKTKKKIKEMR